MTNFSSLIRRTAATVATGILIGTALTSSQATTAAADPAQGTIAVAGTTLEIRLDGAQSNVQARVTSTAAGRPISGFVFSNDHAHSAPRAGTGCRVGSAPHFEVTCVGFDRIVVTGNADRNHVNLLHSLRPVIVDAGAGNDVILGSSYDDTLRGGTDDDQIVGMSGMDDLQGGAGYDEVSYSLQYGGYTVALPVTVVVDGTAGDGAAGENDFVRPDVESIKGGGADDNLSFAPTTALPFPTDAVPVTRTIDGWHGNDVLLGGSGSDVLVGGEGQDQLDGRGGRDLAIGGSGTDACLAESEQECEI